MENCFLIVCATAYGVNFICYYLIHLSPLCQVLQFDFSMLKQHFQTFQHALLLILWQPCCWNVPSHFGNFWPCLIHGWTGNEGVFILWSIGQLSYLFPVPLLLCKVLPLINIQPFGSLNSFRACPNHLKPENCMSPHLFHPCLLGEDRGCLVFLSCFCLWHLFLLHPLFLAKSLQISLTHVPKDIHFHFLMIPDTKHPFPHSEI